MKWQHQTLVALILSFQFYFKKLCVNSCYNVTNMQVSTYCNPVLQLLPIENSWQHRVKSLFKSFSHKKMLFLHKQTYEWVFPEPFPTMAPCYGLITFQVVIINFSGDKIFNLHLRISLASVLLIGHQIAMKCLRETARRRKDFSLLACFIAFERTTMSAFRNCYKLP